MPSEEIVARFESAQDRLVLQAVDLSLETISQMVDDRVIDTEPGYQRRVRWSRERQSRLIESFLLNIPVPPIYLAEDDFGRYSVIDGKQRVTAVRDFLRNEFALTKLEDFHEIGGCRFSDLPPALANALRIRPYLRAVTLLAQSDTELRYEVFTRLNTGGSPLNAQELRNVVFRSPLNDLLLELSEHPYLRARLKIRGPRSSSYRTMADVEYVLRFLTLVNGWESFSGDFRKEMDYFMLDNVEAAPRMLRHYRDIFETTIGVVERLWGDHAFQRPSGQGWRDQTLAGMYDAQMVAVSELQGPAQQQLIDCAPRVLTATRDLFHDSTFEVAVREGTNTPGRVQYRIETMRQALVTLLT
jgi:hypothetical protein